jgi:hypothetical protein
MKSVHSPAPYASCQPFSRAACAVLEVLAACAFGLSVSGCSAKNESGAAVDTTADAASADASSGQPGLASSADATSNVDSMSRTASDGAETSETKTPIDSASTDATQASSTPWSTASNTSGSVSSDTDDTTSSHVESGIGNDTGTSDGDGGTEQTSRPVIPVRFTAFIDASDKPVTVAPTFETEFPDCPREAWAEGEPPQLTRCYAEKIVERMNRVYSELGVDETNAPVFSFESMNVVEDASLYSWVDGEAGQERSFKIEWGYRKPGIVSFVIPGTLSPTAEGVGFVGQRINDTEGMLLEVAATANPGVYLHEFGHGLGFDHVGNLAGVGVQDYTAMGLGMVTPPECNCENINYMAQPAYLSFPETEGCAPCANATLSQYDTPFFAPVYRDVLLYWLEHRLDEPILSLAGVSCAGTAFGWVSKCYDLGEDTVGCVCPSGDTFRAPNCDFDGQASRDELTATLCPTRTCPPPEHAPAAVCEGLVGSPFMHCDCGPGTAPFTIAECSDLVRAECP